MQIVQTKSCERNADVRFGSIRGHFGVRLQCTLSATSGHLFANFASALEQIIALVVATCRA
jgi:hypothetical protein